MPKNALTITDQRNDKTYEAPIENGTIRAMDLRKIKTDPEDFGLMTYDPAFMNTASCKSSITFIDGDKGDPSLSRLRYRNARIGEKYSRLHQTCEGRRTKTDGLRTQSVQEL